MLVKLPHQKFIKRHQIEQVCKGKFPDFASLTTEFTSGNEAPAE